jgi:tRNA(Arg) A34 adenosine deaminase TadA
LKNNIFAESMSDRMRAYFDSAYADAARAGESGEVPVGAVVVHAPTGEIVGRGGNRTIRDCDPTAHAEIIALRAAAKALNNARLDQCDLYVTLEPCPMCAGAISASHIRRLYFGAYDVKGGGVDHGPRVFETCGAAHRPEVTGGIDAERFGALLKNFFAARRDGGR